MSSRPTGREMGDDTAVPTESGDNLDAGAGAAAHEVDEDGDESQKSLSSGSETSLNDLDDGIELDRDEEKDEDEEDEDDEDHLSDDEDDLGDDEDEDEDEDGDDDDGDDDDHDNDADDDGEDDDDCDQARNGYSSQVESPKKCTYDLRTRAAKHATAAGSGVANGGGKGRDESKNGDTATDHSKDTMESGNKDSTRAVAEGLWNKTAAEPRFFTAQNPMLPQYYHQPNVHLSEASRQTGTFPVYPTTPAVTTDPFNASGACTRARAAKVKASIAIQNQLQMAASQAHTNAAIHTQPPCALPGPAQFVAATGLPGIRSIDPTAAGHPYMINPFIQRSPMDMKGTTMPMSATRIMGGPSFAHSSLNLDDISQYWSPGGTEVTGLSLFPTNAHAAQFASISPYNPGQAYAFGASSTTHVQVGSAPASSTATTSHLGSVPHTQTSTTIASSKSASGGTTKSSSKVSSIAAAAHSTTQPVTRSVARRSHGRSSGHHKSSGRDNGSMSKADRRRNKASIRERKRVVSLNEAFHNLKKAMPFVPPDTKLSKIKTLRFAIRYVKRMTDMLSESGDKQGSGGGSGAIGSSGYDDRMDMFDPCGCFGSSYDAPFDDFDLEMDFNTGSQPTLPDVPITINDSDLES